MNAGYASFDDFLASLSSQKRKNIRKERASVAKPGITMHALTGKDIEERHWDAFFDFYMDTGARKWGTPYLNRAFFSLIGEAMSEHILLVMAERGGQADRRGAQLHRLACALWPELGRHRVSRQPAFRDLLLSGHRLRHHPQAGARRGRRAGRPQAGARLSSAEDLQPALPRPPRPAARRGRTISRPSARASTQEQQALAAHSPFRQEQDF